MAGKFELKKTKNGKYMFNLCAGNGEVILTSQSYASKSGARKGIASVQAHAGAGSAFDTKQAASGQSYFVMKANNGRVIGRSEQYRSGAALTHGIKSVQKNALGAAIKDIS